MFSLVIDLILPIASDFYDYTWEEAIMELENWREMLILI